MVFPLGWANHHCHLFTPTKHLMRRLWTEQECIWKGHRLVITVDKPEMERHKRNGYRLTVPVLIPKMELCEEWKFSLAPLSVANVGEVTQCYFVTQDTGIPLWPHRESWWRRRGKLGSVERWLANPVRRKSVSLHSTASPQGSYKRSADSPWKESQSIILQQEEVGFDTKLIG